jgi:HD superfamily phosphohydrolase
VVHRPEPTRRIRTALYGDQALYTTELEIIHTPAMQRLYDLHQLGLADRVFIDASHSRLHHVVGVVEQVSRVISSIAKNLRSIRDRKLRYGDPACEERAEVLADYVQKREREVRLIGLLHDLTHAPYGHTLEDEIHLVHERHDDPQRQADAFYRLLVQLVWGLLHDAGVFTPSRGTPIFDWALTFSRDRFDRLSHYMRAPELMTPPGSGETDARAFIEALGSLVAQVIADDALLASIVTNRGPKARDWRALFGQLRFALRALLHLELLHSSNPESKHFPRPDGSYGYERLLDAILGDQAADYRFLPAYDAFALDIVGNTICADLLDYAKRDSVNAGLRLDYDAERIVENMTLLGYRDQQRMERAEQRTRKARKPPDEQGPVHDGEPDNTVALIDPFSCWTIRTGIGMFSHKLRIDVPGELLNLLQVRFYVYQRALFHPTKCIAGAMLGSALQFIGWDELPPHLRHVGDAVFLRDVRDAAVTVQDLITESVADGLSVDEALTPEVLDGLIRKLDLPLCTDRLICARQILQDQRVAATNAAGGQGQSGSPASRDRINVASLVADLSAAIDLLGRLATRRYFVPVYRFLPGTRVRNANMTHEGIANRFLQPEKRWNAEREIEKRAGLPRGSVVIHCPLAKGPRKIANILMVWRDRNQKEDAQPLRKIDQLDRELFGDHSKAVTALEDMYASMWRLVVSVPPSARVDSVREAAAGNKSSTLENHISDVLHEIIINDGQPSTFENEFTMREELAHAGELLKADDAEGVRQDGKRGDRVDEVFWTQVEQRWPRLRDLRQRLSRDYEATVNLDQLIAGELDRLKEGEQKHGPTLFPAENISADIPRTRGAAKRWLRDQADALMPQVRGRFTRELEPVLDFLFTEVDEESVRQNALVDLRRRLRNEGSKIYNNFKTAQVVRSLRRKWKPERKTDPAVKEQ